MKRMFGYNGQRHTSTHLHSEGTEVWQKGTQTLSGGPQWEDQSWWIGFSEKRLAHHNCMDFPLWCTNCKEQVGQVFWGTLIVTMWMMVSPSTPLRTLLCNRPGLSGPSWFSGVPWQTSVKMKAESLNTILKEDFTAWLEGTWYCSLLQGWIWLFYLNITFGGVKCKADR